jgi:hypothetical protein
MKNKNTGIALGQLPFSLQAEYNKFKKYKIRTAISK